MHQYHAAALLLDSVSALRLENSSEIESASSENTIPIFISEIAAYSSLHELSISELKRSQELDPSLLTAENHNPNYNETCRRAYVSHLQQAIRLQGKLLDHIIEKRLTPGMMEFNETLLNSSHHYEDAQTLGARGECTTRSNASATVMLTAKDILRYRSDKSQRQASKSIGYLDFLLRKLDDVVDASVFLCRSLISNLKKVADPSVSEFLTTQNIKKFLILFFPQSFGPMLDQHEMADESRDTQQKIQILLRFVAVLRPVHTSKRWTKMFL